MDEEKRVDPPDSRELRLLHEINTHVSVIETKLEYIEKDYVKKTEFAPIQKIVYGLTGFILISFLTAIVGLVLLKGGG